MSKQPPHIISMMIYCHRCKSTRTLLKPQDNVEWKARSVIDGDESRGELVMAATCPECQKEIEINLNTWNTLED